MNEPKRDLLRTKEAADYLGISRWILDQGRKDGTGPAFYRAGRRLFMYDRVDLDAWLERSRGVVA